MAKPKTKTFRYDSMQEVADALDERIDVMQAARAALKAGAQVAKPKGQKGKWTVANARKAKADALALSTEVIRVLKRTKSVAAAACNDNWLSTGWTLLMTKRK